MARGVQRARRRRRRSARRRAASRPRSVDTAFTAYDIAVIGDAQDAVGGARHVDAERLGDLLARWRARAAARVERHLAAEEAVGAEAPEHEVGVGDGRLRRRRGRSRPGPGSAPALCGPTRSAPLSSTAAMLPPPVPTSKMSIIGIWIGSACVVAADAAPRRWSALRRGRSRRPSRSCRPCRRRPRRARPRLAAQRLRADHAGRRPGLQHAHALRAAPGAIRTGRRWTARAGTSRRSPASLQVLVDAARRSGSPSGRRRRWRRPSSMRSNSRYSCDSSCDAVTKACGSSLLHDRLHARLVRRDCVAVQEQDRHRVDAARAFSCVAHARARSPRRAARARRPRRVMRSRTSKHSARGDERHVLAEEQVVRRPGG